MKVYLAGDVNRPNEMRTLAEELTELGFEVTTRWLRSTTSFHDISEPIERANEASLDGTAQWLATIITTGERIPSGPLPPDETEARDFYAACKADIGSADLVVALTDADGAWQTVLAEQLQIPVLTVGPLNQPCYYAENITERAANWQQAKIELQAMQLRMPSRSRQLGAFVAES